jgi:hypothetical protein
MSCIALSPDAADGYTVIELSSSAANGANDDDARREVFF